MIKVHDLKGMQQMANREIPMEYRDYYRQFCDFDDETYRQSIPNEDAEAYLYQNAPRLYCPDEVIERIFAFRGWTLRKHVKETPVGFVLTEFLPPVPWAGIYNTINAPLFHHLNELRWFRNARDFLTYIDLFLNGEGRKYAYHTPALTAICDFCMATDNFSYLENNIESLERYFDGWEELHHTENGLYWSIDDNEATEFTISGTFPNLSRGKGLRPLFNGCMYGDAVTLSKIEASLGRHETANHYAEVAARIKKLMDEKMWDGTFYKAIHPVDRNVDKPLTIKDIPEECDARELMSYVPWIYAMPDSDKCGCFAYLKDERVFLAKTGWATAEISHPRFLYPVNHECLWNGYVWPFSTSLTISAVIRLLKDYRQEVFTYDDLYDAILTYANMHTITDAKGTHPFIDEVMHPFVCKWTVRESLERLFQTQGTGIKDRGKDYNHSTFIDLVLRGILGIDPLADEVKIGEEVMKKWDYFRLENLTFKGKTYTVIYDKYGTAYGMGTGLQIIEE